MRSEVTDSEKRRMEMQIKLLSLSNPSSSFTQDGCSTPVLAFNRTRPPAAWKNRLPRACPRTPRPNGQFKHQGKTK
jgi:hypothetical protein